MTALHTEKAQSPAFAPITLGLVQRLADTAHGKGERNMPMAEKLSGASK